MFSKAKETECGKQVLSTFFLFGIVFWFDIVSFAGPCRWRGKAGAWASCTVGTDILPIIHLCCCITHNSSAGGWRGQRWWSGRYDHIVLAGLLVLGKLIYLKKNDVYRIFWKKLPSWWQWVVHTFPATESVFSSVLCYR